MRGDEIMVTRAKYFECEVCKRLTTFTCVGCLTQALRRRGYPEETINRILEKIKKQKECYFGY